MIAIFKNSHHFVFDLLLQVPHNSNYLFIGKNCALILSIFPTIPNYICNVNTINLLKWERYRNGSPQFGTNNQDAKYSNSYYDQKMENAITRITWVKSEVRRRNVNGHAIEWNRCHRYLKANVKQTISHCERRNLKEFGVKDILLTEQCDYSSVPLSKSM